MDVLIGVIITFLVVIWCSISSTSCRSTAGAKQIVRVIVIIIGVISLLKYIAVSIRAALHRRRAKPPGSVCSAATLLPEDGRPTADPS